MRGKMARSAPRPPFGLPEVPIAARTSRLSSREAGKALLFTPVRESSGNPGTVVYAARYRFPEESCWLHGDC